MSYPDWPTTLKPDTSETRLSEATPRLDNPFTGSIQHLPRPNQKWVMSLTFGRRQGAAARQLRGLVMGLTAAGRIWMPVFDGLTPAGSAAGSGLVDGAGQSGTSLVTKGWTPNQTGVLLTGDYFQIGDELKMLTADANANASGVATLTFAPALRTSPANLAPLTVTAPRVLMELADANQAGWAVQSPQVYAISLPLVEWV